MLDPADRLAAEVERQAHLFFSEILPRCLDAWFAGRGYHLITQMLAVHDADAVRDLLTRPAPSERSRRRAAGLRAYCPLTLLDQSVVTEAGLVLGLYTHESLTRPHFLQSFQVVGEVHRVWILGGSFLQGVAPERWPAELLLTIFHEYIHALEAHLPARDQPLRAREQGLPVRTFTPAQAVRADRRYAVRRAALWGGVPALAIGLGIAVAPTVRAPRDELQPEKVAARVDAGPPRDYPAEREALRRRLTQSILEADTREGIIDRVGRPIGDTTDSFSHGVLGWAALAPAPGEGPLPDLAGRAVMCWRQPSEDILSMRLLCAAWLEGRVEIFEAEPKRRDALRPRPPDPLRP